MGWFFFLSVFIVMKNILNSKGFILCVTLFLVSSCGQREIPQKPKEAPRVNLDATEKGVIQACTFGRQAQNSVKDAERELLQAREDAEEAKALVDKMRKQRSQFAEEVEEMRVKYVGRINYLTDKLKETGVILEKQLVSLRMAGREIAIARSASAASEVEKEALRDGNKILAKNLEKEKKSAAKYKEKYDKNLWYKKWFWWSVFGVCVITFVLIVAIVGYVYFAAPSVASGVAARWLRRF